MINPIIKELETYANADKAEKLKYFFKTGPGQYGEGDQFIGINVPIQRKVAKQFVDVDFSVILDLLNSKIHEHRLCGFIILTYKYKKASANEKDHIIEFYLANLSQCNNWDLVDLSAPKILGYYLLDKDKTVLTTLAHSTHLWSQRIAVVTTYEFIRNKHYGTTLHLAKLLLNHPHDLMHKAIGWMLREIGKRDKDVEVRFLLDHYKQMPRTMLRYAIEKFPETERQAFLKGTA